GGICGSVRATSKRSNGDCAVRSPNSEIALAYIEDETISPVSPLDSFSRERLNSTLSRADTSSRPCVPIPADQAEYLGSEPCGSGPSHPENPNTSRRFASKYSCSNLRSGTPVVGL